MGRRLGRVEEGGEARRAVPGQRGPGRLRVAQGPARLGVGSREVLRGGRGAHPESPAGVTGDLTVGGQQYPYGAGRRVHQRAAERGRGPGAVRVHHGPRAGPEQRRHIDGVGAEQQADQRG